MLVRFRDRSVVEFDIRLDDSGWYAYGERARRYVLRDDGACANDAIIANGHARQDHRRDSNEAALPDMNLLQQRQPTINRISVDVFMA